jgi:iron complex outermembrane receptor protein
VLRAAGLVALLAFSGMVWAQSLSKGAHNLGDLSLEQLSNIVVSSVSGRAEPLSRALGSVYVITADDIQRSGATSLPEALRLAPNLQVARTGASGYAITARGFNSVFANKLLVLIDGRSIYTPTFSGVFWDAQSVMLEDIDRIEVISGPGGVLWGANAFNGVINVITKSASATPGGLATAGYGTTEWRGQVRYGGKNLYRIYGQAIGLDDTEAPDGTTNDDGMKRIQAGFRSDWEKGRDAFTVQGDLYAAVTDQEPEDQELRGANVLMRWNRDLGEGSGLRVQTYYDYTSRQQQTLDTFDLEFGQSLRPHGRQTLLWGGGARYARDRIDNSPALAFLPPDKSLFNWNVFLQDVVALQDDFDMTFGLRVDRNTYTGIEFLPSVRIGWRPENGSLLWAAASRAVRTPSRFDTELFLPGSPPFLLAGGPDFRSELANVFELGYRDQPFERWSWAATLFYNQLERQRSIAPGPDGAVVANDLEGHSEGIEAWGAFRIFGFWRLWAGYNYLHKELHVVPGAIDLQPPSNDGGDPRQWGKLRSSWDIGKAVQLDLMIRYYDEIEALAVPAYTAVDLFVQWRVSGRFDLSLLVQNLFDESHIEWSPGAEFKRAVYLKALVRF